MEAVDGRGHCARLGLGLGQVAVMLTPSVVPHDIVALIMRVGREIAHGLDLGGRSAVGALARQIETECVPRIIPDRRYTLRELRETFGYTHSAFYRHRRHLIRKDGRKSYVLGRELLADLEAYPRLGPIAGGSGKTTALPRPRGRSRKNPGSVST